MFAPEQFEQCFQEMMEEALKPNIIQRAFQFITRNPDYISHKQIVTTPLITHRYKLADIEAAYHLFENKLDGVIKIAVEP